MARKISIVIPTLNEVGNIPALLERVDSALGREKIGYEVIFIDDHSTDGTREVIVSFKDRFPVKVFLKSGRRGKAYSLIEGFAMAKYPVIAILDADLQYPPEAIPEMLTMLESEKADVVVARRVQRDVSVIRKITSKVFFFIFARLLYGLDCDVQSGLKVFHRDAVRAVNFNPTPWTFDLEFLINARDMGYRVGSVDISFAERSAGESKINILQTVWELSSNAVKIKFRPRMPIVIPPNTDHLPARPDGTVPRMPVGMIGAGLSFKRKQFITHTTLNPSVSSFKTFSGRQKLFITALLFLAVASFWFAPLYTGITILGVLSVFYFSDALFNMVLVLRSLRNPPELSYSDEYISQVDDADLPIYTVLCPLFREHRVLPGFIDAIGKLDWPKEKLDVMLLLEENDTETIRVARGMDLPGYVRIVVVPHSLPKTKPKACNYGLSLARGELLVIYDAEDIPEPSQLKKAWLGFREMPADIKCLQAKLNYFNSGQNLLTRLFTAEYSLWFDVILPGLQSLNTTIPLGGTSNHFRTADLRELKGWDPFNVTEDADLGVRLFTSGYRTAIIDSITLEEANSNLVNWIRQRSRWIKGYMQTYLVHMRKPLEFFRRSPKHFFYFQLNVGGKIAFMLINPILWATTISYFTFRPTLGPLIEQLYPTVILYIGVFSLVFGNFLYLYYYMIGCAKRGHWGIIKYVFLVPFYWLFMSFSALMALYELIVRPHYWQKTHHGLHLAKEPGSVAVPVHEPSFKATASVPSYISGGGGTVNFSIAGKVTKLPKERALVSRGGILIGAMVLANFLNFVFNAFLGRKLNLDDLGLLTLINTLWYVASIFINSISSTVNQRTAFLSAKEHVQAGIHFWKVTLRMATIVALVVSAIWLVATPFLSEFFNIQNVFVLLMFTPAMTLGVIVTANRGFLQGNLMFHQTAIVTVTEATSKLLMAATLVFFNLHGLVFLSIPFSIFMTAGVAMILSRRLEARLATALTPPIPKYEFPKFFYAASVMSSISAAIFLSLDIILVKHYMTPMQAGEYALLSLVGKMIYFMASLPGAFMITFVSRAFGQGKNTKDVFGAIFSSTAAIAVGGFVVLGIFGHEFVPFLFGSKTAAILPQLPMYTLAIGMFSLVNSIVAYHLARREYIFSAMSLFASALMATGIVISHNSIGDIVKTIMASSVFGLSLMALLHVFEEKLKFVTSNAVDFFDAFVKRLPVPKPAGAQRILIFNWRDTKHVFAGGAEVYIHELARRLVQDGHQVTQFCGNDGKHPRNEVINGVNIVRRGGFYFVYVWAPLYYIFQFRGKFDIVIDCHNGIPFFTPLYVREKVYCLVHHVHQEVFTRYLPYPLAVFARFLERDLMPVVYRNTEFITVSDSTRKAMLKFGYGNGRGAKIVHNGVDLVNYVPSQKSPSPTILYLGRLQAYKSVDVLLVAFKLISEKVKDAVLVIAGGGEEENHLKRLAKQLGISDSVVFTGKISEADKIKHLQRAWVMVNPSFVEGWGITTIEANACGTPVVASDVPGLRDSVRHLETGYLVKYGDSEAFADKITSIIMDHKVRDEMAARSRKWAENFSWENSAKTLASTLSINE